MHPTKEKKVPRTTARNRILILSVFMLGLISFGHSQNPVLEECVKISRYFRTADRLSFDLKYTYANDSFPSIIIDSSIGSFKIHGSHYRGSRDSVEFMQNDSFQLIVYKQEHLITIGSSSHGFEKSLPQSQWDSLFIKNDFSYTFSSDGGYKKITADYDPEISLIKKIEIWYDSSTYRLFQVRYKMDESIFDVSLREQGYQTGSVMVVNIFFNNYQTGLFNSDEFNSARYIQPLSEGFPPAPAYAGYEIFIVSPGLKY